MSKIYIDLKKIKDFNYSGLIVIFSLLAALIVLCYVLFHNPYKEIHSQIFQTADNVRAYYRDQPGYWKLDTKSAIDDRLVAKKLEGHKKYAFKIGIGVNGDMAMPSDLNFDIVLKNLNKSACIGLLEAPLGKEQALALQKITVINSNGTTEYIWGNGQYSLPIKKYSARNVCQPSGNVILWNFQ